MSRWQIPPPDPAEVTVARLRELESVTERRIRNQHVVSRVILKGFAAPGRAGKGWELTPFDVRAGREDKPRGLRGCGRVPDFLMCAAESAEQLWNAEVENHLESAIKAARDGHLHDSGAHVTAIRDGIALHLVRSLRYLEINRAAVAQSIENIHRTAPVARRALLEAEFQRRHGLVSAGPEALATLLNGPLTKWRSLDERGVIARASIEAMFRRVRDALRLQEVEVWHVPPGHELLISDSPAIPFRYSTDHTRIQANVAVGDASGIALPLARDCIAAIGPKPGDGELLPSTVELFNQLLHRTLHAAELAGLDAGELMTRAVAQRDLIGIRDIPAAIDARIRQRHGDLTPLPAPAWSDQVPETGDLERSRFLTQLAAVMDDRRRRIGEHAAASRLPWALAALGTPPDDPAARLVWQRKAAAIGAYRELSGHDDPDDPIGPEPANGSPDLRAAWHEARATLAPNEASDIRHLTDGQLLNPREACPDDSRAPLPDVGKLRQARAAARDANVAALRAHAEASAARRRGDHDTAARQGTLAASYQAMRDAHRARETELDTAISDQLATTELEKHDRDSQPSALATSLAETSRQLGEAAKRHRDLAARLTDPYQLTIPAQDPVRDISPAFPLTTAQRRTAILQPPKPEIPPSSWILDRVAGRDLDLEAGD